MGLAIAVLRTLQGAGNLILKALDTGCVTVSGTGGVKFTMVALNDQPVM